MFLQRFRGYSLEYVLLQDEGCGVSPIDVLQMRHGELEDVSCNHNSHQGVGLQE